MFGEVWFNKNVDVFGVGFPREIKDQEEERYLHCGENTLGLGLVGEAHNSFP